jgi:hypothetical protein
MEEIQPLSTSRLQTAIGPRPIQKRSGPGGDLHLPSSALTWNGLRLPPGGCTGRANEVPRQKGWTRGPDCT